MNMANMWWFTFVQTLKTYSMGYCIKSQNHPTSPLTFPNQVVYFSQCTLAGCCAVVPLYSNARWSDNEALKK